MASRSNTVTQSTTKGLVSLLPHTHCPAWPTATHLDHVELPLHDGPHEQRNGEDLEIAQHLGGGWAEEQLQAMHVRYALFSDSCCEAYTPVGQQSYYEGSVVEW